MVKYSVLLFIILPLYTDGNAEIISRYFRREESFDPGRVVYTLCSEFVKKAVKCSTKERIIPTTTVHIIPTTTGRIIPTTTVRIIPTTTVRIIPTTTVRIIPTTTGEVVLLTTATRFDLALFWIVIGSILCVVVIAPLGSGHKILQTQQKPLKSRAKSGKTVDLRDDCLTNIEAAHAADMFDNESRRSSLTSSSSIIILATCNHVPETNATFDGDLVEDEARYRIARFLSEPDAVCAGIPQESWSYVFSILDEAPEMVSTRRHSLSQVSQDSTATLEEPTGTRTPLPAVFERMDENLRRMAQFQCSSRQRPASGSGDEQHRESVSSVQSAYSFPTASFRSSLTPSGNESFASDVGENSNHSESSYDSGLSISLDETDGV